MLPFSKISQKRYSILCPSTQSKIHPCHSLFQTYTKFLCLPPELISSYHVIVYNFCPLTFLFILILGPLYLCPAWITLSLHITICLNIGTITFNLTCFINFHSNVHNLASYLLYLCTFVSYVFLLECKFCEGRGFVCFVLCCISSNWYSAWHILSTQK